MKKLFLVLFTMSVACFSSVNARWGDDDDKHESRSFATNLTKTIPQIEESNPYFEKKPNVAQYGEADWSQVVGITHNVTLDKAFDIALKNETITYFFYMKEGRMVLGSKEEGAYRIFHQGDAVFFSGTPSWGAAPGFSDGYIKKQAEHDAEGENN